MKCQLEPLLYSQILPPIFVNLYIFYDHLFIFCFPGYRVAFKSRSSIFFLSVFIQADFIIYYIFNYWKNPVLEHIPFEVIATSFSYATSIFPILSSMSLVSLLKLHPYCWKMMFQSFFSNYFNSHRKILFYLKHSEIHCEEIIVIYLFSSS